MDLKTGKMSTEPDTKSCTMPGVILMKRKYTPRATAILVSLTILAAFAAAQDFEITRSTVDGVDDLGDTLADYSSTA